MELLLSLFYQLQINYKKNKLAANNELFLNWLNEIFFLARITHRTFPTLLIVQHRRHKKAMWKKLSVHSEEIKNERHQRTTGEKLNFRVRVYVCAIVCRVSSTCAVQIYVYTQYTLHVIKTL